MGRWWRCLAPRLLQWWQLMVGNGRGSGGQSVTGRTVNTRGRLPVRLPGVDARSDIRGEDAPAWLGTLARRPALPTMSISLETSPETSKQFLTRTELNFVSGATSIPSQDPKHMTRDAHSQRLGEICGAKPTLSGGIRRVSTSGKSDPIVRCECLHAARKSSVGWSRNHRGRRFVAIRKLGE